MDLIYGEAPAQVMSQTRSRIAAFLYVLICQAHKQPLYEASIPCMTYDSNCCLHSVSYKPLREREALVCFKIYFHIPITPMRD